MLARQFTESFNSKDLDAILSLFHLEVTSHGLFDESLDFQMRCELGEIYTKLFEVNPNVRCELLSSFEDRSHLVMTKKYSGFQCGAESATVWNVELKDGLIWKILQHSKHKPGKG